ncbi:MAG: preprotein translocase subunit SecA [Lachnospiraceae bacterium]|nr:preprotein translocase subunit SecA [Lachnospiraceae bacterium]
MGFLDKIFGSYSDREIKKIESTVNKIEALDSQMQALTDDQLKAKTQEFKKRLANGETLDDLLVEAYAVVREAAVRVLGMKHYRVQLMGGIILHQGRISEMKTGEGKTLVATLPSYLNALEGKGVHVVTVNDYLAKRDAEWMGQIHRFLGLTVGVILNSYDNDERRAAYNCDITYVTNNELGFDYLRDNMVIYKEQLVQRELNFAIVDEVDSVLIDEARTPLIISGQSGKSTDLYKVCDFLARRMRRGVGDGELSKIDAIMGEEAKEDGDFLVNEKEKQVILTAEGIKKIEEYFHIDNLADADNLEIQHNIILALRAHNLMFRDQDYVVKDNEVLIVDEFTGRIMPGRRYSDGLHQAIEAKEGVKVRRESRTLATITFQNFFNKYAKKAGMTGTALTEENEFREIYGMDVVVIPTNKPVQRKDWDDAIYMTKNEKFKAVVREIQEAHAKGQPCLVGTITIETSELLSNMLRKVGIPHTVLNAKFHEQEAEIVAAAGEIGAVTIATNMAGRGTDIKLAEGVAERGGLKIIGTERHEARRIDNQLRGRSGRQGDPGESKFYLSLEDDLMRLFGSERMLAVYRALNIPEGEEIQHKTISATIEKAQKKIESNNFSIRRNLLEYDRVNNEQREIMYNERRRVLDGEDMRESIMNMMDKVISDAVAQVAGDGLPAAEWDMKELNQILLPKIPMAKIALTEEEKAKNDLEGFTARIQELGQAAYAKKEAEFAEHFPEEYFRELERIILLKVIDRKWMTHIDDMDQLRQGVGLQAYGQKDPVVQYKFLGYDMFDELIRGINEDTITGLMHLRIEQHVEREQVAKVTGTNKDDSVAKGPYVRKEAKIGRNDPCPCGSGKKYKQCCGRNV